MEEWLTTADRISLFAEQPQRLIFNNAKNSGPVIDVNDSVRFQTMDGFGFALTGGSAQLLMQMGSKQRSALLKELFTTKGTAIGVSYLRISIGSSDMNDHVYTYDDMPAGEDDPSLEHFSIAEDQKSVIPVLKEILAIDPKIAILASPWSAPSWMKTNDKPKAGSLRPEMYDIYARYLVKYLQTMASEGIHISALTIQNEPLNENNTPSMHMTSAEQDTFIKNALGPLFHKDGIQTKIILYDHNLDKPEYPLDILADPVASQYVAGSGFHLYEGQVDAMTRVHDAYPDKGIYFTEQMVIQPDDKAPLDIASPVSHIVIGATRNWSKIVLLWNLAADEHFGPHTDNGGCPVCQGAITIKGNDVSRNLAFYTIAHVAKFVRPGSIRIESNVTTPDILPNVAFETPDHHDVLLVANTGQEKQNFSVRYHGRQFTSSLAARSVATYVWR